MGVAGGLKHKDEASDREVSDMQLFNASRLSGGGSALELEEELVCPECGATMVEFDKLTEDGAVFIWYTCTREDCSGQWLTKRAPRMCGI